MRDSFSATVDQNLSYPGEMRTVKTQQNRTFPSCNCALLACQTQIYTVKEDGGIKASVNTFCY
jgi:hypothetical protein